MSQEDSKLWDSVADRSKEPGLLSWPAYYTHRSYTRATDLALNHVCFDSGRINLLKSDLWEEGIETWMTILGQYENDERLNLCAVDISRTTCSAALKQRKAVNVVQGDIRGLPFTDASFDMVMDLSTLDHVTLQEAEHTLGEYGRVLRHNGILLVAYWRDTRFTRLLLRLKWIRLRVLEAGGNQYYLPDRMVKGCIQRDFDIVQEFSIGSVLNAGYLLTVNQRLVSTVDRALPHWLARLLVKVEYSRSSKWLLSSVAGLHAIIARRNRQNQVSSRRYG